MNIFKAMKVAMLILLCGVAVHVFADNEPASKKEYTPEEQQELWQQPDFVKAYLVVAEPGGALYSIFGHACLHMVCPAYGLNYYFTYESEEVSDQVFAFLSGNLKMCLEAQTPDKYLKGFKEQGRGVKEYELNLPIDAKRKLWQILDEHLPKGVLMPFDFKKRGCAISCVRFVQEALGDQQVILPSCILNDNRTIRELGSDYAPKSYAWQRWFICNMLGTGVDREIHTSEKLVYPQLLADAWHEALINGEPLLASEAIETLPSIYKHEAPWCTPMMVAIILLVLAVISFFVRFPYIDWLILGVVTLIGFGMAFLVFFSPLPWTGWSWLLIPFNFLPVIVWKWRRYWALPYAGIIIIWALTMLFAPHMLVDSSMIVLAFAFVMVLINDKNNKCLCKLSISRL